MTYETQSTFDTRCNKFGPYNLGDTLMRSQHFAGWWFRILAKRFFIARYFDAFETIGSRVHATTK
jgi:hypothetical protein